MFDCPVCGRKSVRFKKVKRREHCACACGSRERHRAFALVLRDEGIHSADAKNVYHLRASEPAVGRFVFKRWPQNHRVQTGNLLSIHKQHAENSLHFVLHNHVMEHVEKDAEAFRLQFHVLQPGGKLVFTIPLRHADGVLIPETYKLDRLLDKAGRRQHYGQWNHVRFYGVQSVLDLLTTIGFEARYVECLAVYGAEVVARCSLGLKCGVFVAVKP